MTGTRPTLYDEHHYKRYYQLPRTLDPRRLVIRRILRKHINIRYAGGARNSKEERGKKLIETFAFQNKSVKEVAYGLNMTSNGVNMALNSFIKRHAGDIEW